MLRRLASAWSWSWSLSALACIAAPAQALELRYGQTYTEQGDYLLHPGIKLALKDDRGRQFRADLYGRRFGAFTEATLILGMDEELKVFPWDDLTLLYGFSVMDQYTQRDSGMRPKSEVHSLNLGVNIGLHYQVYRYENWTLHTGWDSHLFAAGFAFLLLTTARKSIFTLAAGYTL